MNRRAFLPRKFRRREVVDIDGVANDGVGARERFGLRLRDDVFTHQPRDICERLSSSVTGRFDFVFDGVALDGRGKSRFHPADGIGWQAADKKAFRQKTRALRWPPRKSGAA